MGQANQRPGWAAGLFGCVLLIVLFVCGVFGANLIWGLRATGEITKPTVPALDETQAKELDVIFGANDETQLRQYFGFPEMLNINIALNKVRREHFAQTHNPDMDLTPFMQNRQMQFSSAYDIDSVRRTPGPLVAKLDIDSVSVLILSENYSVHKAELLKYENSSGPPPSVTCTIKDFDRALQLNVDLMQNLFNDLMRKSPNYFVLYDDASHPEYFKVIDTLYWGRFNQFRPVADQIRDALRKARGNS
jgi:hypothetical protein